MSSAVFGVWHVLPTLNSLDTNPGASATAGSVLLQAGAVAFVVLATGVAGALLQLAAAALRQHPRAVAHAHRLQLDRVPRKPAGRAAGEVTHRQSDASRPSRREVSPMRAVVPVPFATDGYRFVSVAPLLGLRIN